MSSKNVDMDLIHWLIAKTEPATSGDWPTLLALSVPKWEVPMIDGLLLEAFGVVVESSYVRGVFYVHSLVALLLSVSFPDEWPMVEVAIVHSKLGGHVLLLLSVSPTCEHSRQVRQRVLAHFQDILEDYGSGVVQVMKGLWQVAIHHGSRGALENEDEHAKVIAVWRERLVRS